MTDYYMHLNSAMSQNGNKRLLNTLGTVGDNDTLNITMNSVDSAQSLYLTKILDGKGFQYLPKGSHDGNVYTLVAKKAKDKLK